MALSIHSITHQTSLMLIATAQSPRMVAVCICFLLLADGISARSQVKELQSCRKKELVFYVHQNDQTDVTAASPSGNDVVEFGTIDVIDNVLRSGFANDSTPVGLARGLLIYGKDLSISVAVTYELPTPGCAGSLTGQGTVDSKGNGELVITGGTGAYRWVQGYVHTEGFPVSTDPTYVIFKDTVHLRYF